VTSLPTKVLFKLALRVNGFGSKRENCGHDYFAAVVVCLSQLHIGPLGIAVIFDGTEPGRLRANASGTVTQRAGTEALTATPSRP
jgi:hypothetical protein